METPTTVQSSEIAAIRATIDQFLQERLQPKLEKLKEGEDEKRQQLLEAHRPERGLPTPPGGQLGSSW